MSMTRLETTRQLLHSSSVFKVQCFQNWLYPTFFTKQSFTSVEEHLEQHAWNRGRLIFQDRTLYINILTALLVFLAIWDINISDGEYYKSICIRFKGKINNNNNKKRAFCLWIDRDTFCDLCESNLFHAVWWRHTQLFQACSSPYPLLSLDTTIHQQLLKYLVVHFFSLPPLCLSLTHTLIWQYVTQTSHYLE